MNNDIIESKRGSMSVIVSNALIDVCEVQLKNSTMVFPSKFGV